MWILCTFKANSPEQPHFLPHEETLCFQGGTLEVAAWLKIYTRCLSASISDFINHCMGLDPSCPKLLGRFSASSGLLQRDDWKLAIYFGPFEALDAGGLFRSKFTLFTSAANGRYRRLKCWACMKQSAWSQEKHHFLHLKQSQTHVAFFHLLCHTLCLAHAWNNLKTWARDQGFPTVVFQTTHNSGRGKRGLLITIAPHFGQVQRGCGNGCNGDKWKAFNI